MPKIWAEALIQQSQSGWQQQCGEGRWFTLIIHIFTHFKMAPAESFMRPFCALPLNKYVNYWVQQLPRNMPPLWVSSQMCAAFPGKEPRTAAEDSSQTHGYICAAPRRNRRLRVSSEPEMWVQVSVCGRAAPGLQRVASNLSYDEGGQLQVNHKWRGHSVLFFGATTKAVVLFKLLIFCFRLIPFCEHRFV